LPLSNIQSRSSINERWLKMYRKIHNLFLRNDYVHVDDYKLMLSQLNTRISELESKLNANITTTNANINKAVLGHTHICSAPTSSSGPGVSTAPASPPPASATKPVEYSQTNLEARDRSLQATGPGVAPLMNGTSAEEAAASAQSVQDIGA